MATSTGKTKCVKCAKDKTTSKCSGCLQDFCFNHLVEHRQQLEKQFDDLENERNIFRQELTDQNTCLENNTLIEKINRWEQESIEKIRKIAEKQRQKIIGYTKNCVVKIEKQLNELTQKLKEIRSEDDFNEMILCKLQNKLKELENELHQPSNVNIQEEPSTFIAKMCVVIKSEVIMTPAIVSNELINVKWKQNGITVIGGNGKGSELNQINESWCIYADRDQTIYVSDCSNHRIVEWKKDATYGRIVAGGNGVGQRNDQLNYPRSVIVDYRTDSLIICDTGNKRVVRWPRQNGRSGETIISNVQCWDLVMDNDEYLYVSDTRKHEVRRWEIGEKNGTLVAGGNRKGDRLDQLNEPRYICVDHNQTVYVSDFLNSRVMKWTKGAKEGIVVAGGNGSGPSRSQVYYPARIMIDHVGTIYITDFGNHRIVRWLKEAKECSIMVGGNGEGNQPNQLNYPIDSSFDQQNNLYVLDRDNYRVQKFLID